MNRPGLLKSSLKRGALLTGANWPVVLIQFAAESMFKLLLAAPILCAALVVALLLGRDLYELLSGGLRETVTTIASALISQPLTLVAFLFAIGIVLLGGSALMFLVKGGTVSVLADAEATVGAIEEPPLRLIAFRAASRYSISNYLIGGARLSRRYLMLGLALIVVYFLSAVLYLVVVFAGYRWISNRTLVVAWTLIAALISTLLVVWITAVNLIYLLIQIIMAVSGRGIRWSVSEVFRFLKTDLWDVIGVFGVILLLVVLATAASIAATAGLGLIAFMPIATLVVLPVQLGAWLLRNLLFQYLGLTALAAYLHLYRSSGLVPQPARRRVGAPAPHSS